MLKNIHSNRYNHLFSMRQKAKLHDNDLRNDIVAMQRRRWNSTVVTISSKVNMSSLDNIVTIVEFHRR